MNEDKKCYCDLDAAQTPVRELAEGLDENRQRLILLLDNKWVDGTTIKYFLFKEGEWAGSTRQMDLMREGFKAWKDVGIGLEFEEVDDIKESMVRIGFKKGDGSWSYLGRYVLQLKQDERTMNIGWDNSDTLDTCIHEIGHTLSLNHEHQNPLGGIVWDEEAVYEALGGPPNNWSREKTYHNIIRKLDPRQVQGSEWDKDSIMHYPFEAGMIKEPEIYQTQPLIPEDGLSPLDKETVLQFYPPVGGIKSEELELDKPIPITLDDGGQERFIIKLETETVVEIFTTGEADTFMALFSRQENGTTKQLVSDDDSGESRNARIRFKLEANTDYVLQMRLYWQNRKNDGEPTVLPKLHMVIHDTGGCCNVL